MSAPPQVFVGAMVHYVTDEGEHRPAIVFKVHAILVDLVVFSPYGTNLKERVERSAGRWGTWHWPEAPGACLRRDLLEAIGEAVGRVDDLEEVANALGLDVGVDDTTRGVTRRILSTIRERAVGREILRDRVERLVQEGQEVLRRIFLALRLPPPGPCASLSLATARHVLPAIDALRRAAEAVRPPWGYLFVSPPYPYAPPNAAPTTGDPRMADITRTINVHQAFRLHLVATSSDGDVVSTDGPPSYTFDPPLEGSVVSAAPDLDQPGALVVKSTDGSTTGHFETTVTARVDAALDDTFREVVAVAHLSVTITPEEATAADLVADDVFDLPADQVGGGVVASPLLPETEMGFADAVRALPPLAAVDLPVEELEAERVQVAGESTSTVSVDAQAPPSGEPGTSGLATTTTAAAQEGDDGA